MIHNINLDKLLAPDGYSEKGDGEMQNNTFRKTKEETGFLDLELFYWHKKNNFLPIDIDTHYIPENKKKEELEHFHHDFRYFFIYNGNFSDINIQEEMKGLEILDFDGNFLEKFKEKVYIKIFNLIKNENF